MCSKIPNRIICFTFYSPFYLFCFHKETHTKRNNATHCPRLMLVVHVLHAKKKRRKNESRGKCKQIKHPFIIFIYYTFVRSNNKNENERIILLCVHSYYQPITDTILIVYFFLFLISFSMWQIMQPKYNERICNE